MCREGADGAPLGVPLEYRQPWQHERSLAEQPDTLTAREREVVDLYKRGMSQRAIALALGISRSAVRDRLDAAGRKLVATHEQHAGPT